MERELWRTLYNIVLSVGRAQHTPHVQFRDWKIVIVHVWAVFHHRPTCWACQACNWPEQARRLSLPSPSTMSRRLGRDAVIALLHRVEEALRRQLPHTDTVHIDARALPVGMSSKDPDAAIGYGGGRLQKGYGWHCICSDQRVPQVWSIHPLNVKEQTAAGPLIEQLTGRGTIVGDNQYDANRLYDHAGRRGWQLVAPRRKGTALGHQAHSVWRIKAHVDMPADKREALIHGRDEIERFFGQLGNVGFGLSHLPNWVRRLQRVERWVQAKLILFMTYCLLLQEHPT